MTRTIEIVDFGSATEAILLRAILEHLGLRVGMTFAGNPRAFLDALSRDCDDLILCGHGLSGGFIMGTFAPEVDTSMLDGERLMPNALADTRIVASTVISTACETGTRAMGQRFAQCGANLLVAPAKEPSGTAPPLILHQAYHAVVFGKLGLEDAIARAQGHFPADDRFTLFNLAQSAIEKVST